MNFTFGIITAKSHHADVKPNNFERINWIIDTIEELYIPQYEVIIVGECDVDRQNTQEIKFDETIKDAWITRKKNIITDK